LALERLAEDRLRDGVGIDVRSVEGGDSGVECRVDTGVRGVVLDL